jgi:hypothetical protein
MNWPSREQRRTAIRQDLDDFAQNVMPLPGAPTPVEREVLSTQIVASLRREDYYRLIQQRGAISAARADPHSPSFEAELGVVHLLQNGRVDEAAWLIFLMVYFARPVEGWGRLAQVYGRLGQGRWDWATVSANPAAFGQWLAANWMRVSGKFGSHRKYESLKPGAPRPMGRAVQQYVNWIQGGGGHARHFASIVRAAGNHPGPIFDAFYKQLPVIGFGRLGRFDWVSMLARFGLIHAIPDTAYLEGATGPAYGARLLFQGNRKARSTTHQVQQWLDLLDQRLGVGMVVLEDALCNWQKSPQRFVHFKG